MRSESDAKLFISGIPPEYTKSQVRKLFERLGFKKYIKNVCIFRNKRSGFVIVSPSHAEDVIRGANGKMIDGINKLSVRVFHEKKSQNCSKPRKRPKKRSDSDKNYQPNVCPAKDTSKQGKSIIVENISEFLTKEDIETIADCPESHVTIEINETRYAVLTIPKYVDAEEVCRKLNGMAFFGEKLHAYVDQPRSPVKHQNEDLTPVDGHSLSNLSSRRKRGRKRMHAKHHIVANNCSEPIQDGNEKHGDSIVSDTLCNLAEPGSEESNISANLFSPLAEAQQDDNNLSKDDCKPTNVVFHVNCKTDKTKFVKYVRHHLENTEIEFVVKEIKLNEDKQSSDVTVQFPSFQIANETLSRLQEQSDLTGQICLQEKSSAEILLNKKIAEFKESIERKKTLFLAKHKNKMGRLTEERKQLILPQKCPINVFQDITARRSVVSQAIVECNRQENEFTTYCTSLYGKLRELESRAKELVCESKEMQTSEQNLNEKLTKLRKTFGIECNRLERALPMYAYRSDIIDITCTQDHQVFILIGETGSGKSTQLVQYIYESGMAEDGIIVCTQPRKVAAISLAKHVSTEMGVALGQALGYKTGMKGNFSEKTKVVYLTDHTLLNECIADPMFSKYACLIIDEAHERSLSTDLLLAFIKKCLPKRPDLKVIITSATIDPDIFDDYFGGGCPIIKVPGRTYPVDVEWNQLKSDKSPLERNYVSDAVEVACQLHEREPPGDILVFLTSAAEIEKACQSATNKVGNNVIVLPLHGKLPPEEQQKVFQQDDQRKIVFATNVAETSVTIPGVKYIVDTGLAKELCFDPKKNMNSLEVRLISKSSAEQRKGRAGRTSAGKCYRLYSEVIYNDMPDKSLPEILRVTLETTALKLHEFGVTNVLSFDFVEEPDRAALEKAVANLEFLEAIKDGRLTELGRKMAALPLDPHLSRILLDGITWGIGLEAAVSTAISTLAGSVFFRAGTDEMKEECDMKTITFCHPAGDQMTFLHTYFQWNAQEPSNQNKWCVENYVNAKSMRMVREVVKEFRDILRIRFNVILENRSFNPEIAEEVLPKLYFDTFVKNICIFLGHERVGYINNNLPGERLFIFHGSPLRQLNVVPKLLVYEKTLVTTQHFLLQALPVKEEWIHEAIQSGKLACHPRETSLYKQYCVVPVVETNLGKFCLKQIQRSWQKKKEQVMEIINEAEPQIDYDFKQGVMKVFVPTDHRDTVTLIISTYVSEIKGELNQEVCEKGITKDDDNVRVVLKCGAAVKHVLMPDQYRTIIVKGPSVFQAKVEIVKSLKRFGEIEKADNKEFRSEKQLLVTFADPDCAQEAVRSFSIQLQLPHGTEVQPFTPYKRQQDNLSAFTLHVEWCRRARKTHAFVNFENVEDFSIAVQRFCHFGFRRQYALLHMKFRPSKDGSTQLFVTNVDFYLTEDKMKEAISCDLPEVSEDKFDVKIGYEKSFETTPKDLRNLKEELNGLVEPYATAGKYWIKTYPPKNYFKTYKAQIKFENPDEGYSAMKRIQCGHIEGKELTVTAELSSTVRYTSKVYTAVEKSIQEVASEIHCRYKSVKVDHGKKDDKGNIIVRITSEDVNTFIIAKHALSSVISPFVFDCCKPEIREFIRTENCKKALEKIESTTSTFIRIDRRRPAISIYGNESNKNWAMIEFNKCLSFLDDGTKCFEIRLKEAGKPPGLMKYLVSEFGPGLQQLGERDSVTTIRLDPRRQIITVFATQNEYEFLVGKIEDFTKSLDPNLLRLVHHHQADEVECCVCFTVIINPSEIFRLECCGHTYCIDCIKTQVAPSTVEFPVKCAAEDCSECLVWRDLYSLSELTGFNIRHMVNASVRSYVAANQDKVRNCPTPDCSMIYSVTKDGKCFFCQQCGAIVCTTCHEPYHEGVTCAMYESGRAADQEFEDWLRRDPDNRKRCPKCSSPIEKDYGCNHMECSQCRAHICWFCLDYFKSSGECYNHMSGKHGSLGL